jgi:hypothetical protein
MYASSQEIILYDMTERATKTLLTIALAALMMFQLVAAYPGYLSFDSAYQWLQARVGEVTSLWPPGSVYLLQLFDAIWIGPHLVFILQIVAYWSCATTLMWFARGRAQAWASACALALLPIMWVCIPHVWSDVLLAVLLFAVVVMLIAIDRVASNAKRRALLAVALVCLVYASIVRHNAIVAIVPLAVWWCAHALRATGSTSVSPRHVAVASCVFVGLTFAFYVATLNRASTIRADTYAITLIWDVQAISVATNQNLIPKEISADTSIEDLRAGFDPVHALQLYDKTKANWANSALGLTAAQKHVLQTAWFDAVIANPGAYVWHRARVMYRMLGRKSEPARNGGSDERARVQLKDNPRDALANPKLLAIWHAWSDWLKAGWWATPLAWIGVASVGFFACAIRAINASRARRDADLRLFLQPLCIWLSAALYLASFFFTTPAADMRYAMWPTIAMTIAVLLMWSATRPATRGVTRYSG